jgi:hypothetical protein
VLNKRTKEKSYVVSLDKVQRLKAKFAAIPTPQVTREKTNVEKLRRPFYDQVQRVFNHLGGLISKSSLE